MFIRSISIITILFFTNISSAGDVKINEKHFDEIKDANLQGKIIEREKFRIIGTDQKNLHDVLTKSELHDIWPEGIVPTPSGFALVYDTRFETYEETSRIGEEAVDIYKIQDPSIKLNQALVEYLSNNYKLTTNDATKVNLTLDTKTAYWALQVQGGKYVLWINYEIEFKNPSISKTFAKGNCMYMSKAESKNKDIGQWFVNNAGQLNEELNKSIEFCKNHYDNKIFKYKPKA
jgi:hypothetical protein